MPRLPADYCLNDMNITNTPHGDLPNLTKEEFIDWVMECIPEMEVSNRNMQYWSRPDGRVLAMYCVVFPACPRFPRELVEFHAQSYTLNQRTPRCLRKWRQRQAFIYHEKQGKYYKQHPSGYWYNIY